MGQLVTSQIEESIATVVINNPPKNLLTSQVLKELEEVIDIVSNDPAIKAVILTGGGGLFVAGADIKEILALSTSQEGERVSKKGHGVLNKIELMHKPAIAAVTGFCLGGGLEIALACHIRIAGDRTRLGLPEINLGIMPGFGGTQRLPRLVGRAKALELILTGDMIAATEAKTLGLVNQVVPETDVLKQAQGLAKKIASKSRMAIASVMKAVVEESAGDLTSGLSLEAEIFGGLCETHDMKEGLTAFIEKRQPKFQDK